MTQTRRFFALGWLAVLPLVAAAQTDPEFVLSQLGHAAPAHLEIVTSDSRNPRATATGYCPGSPTDHVLALSNGLGTDTLSLDRGNSFFQIVINGKPVPIGPSIQHSFSPPSSGDPESRWPASQWPITAIALSASRKWFAAPGVAVWPPRGLSATLTYSDPTRSGLRIEIEVDMVDGFVNDALQAVIVNASSDPVEIGRVSWQPYHGKILARSSAGGWGDHWLGVSAVLPPGARMTIPRITAALAGPGGDRWPSEFVTTIMPWSERQKLTAWIRATDAEQASSEVRRAAQAGFKRIAIQALPKNSASIITAAVTEAQRQKIEPAWAWSANNLLGLTDLAQPGDGLPCRASATAVKLISDAQDRAAGLGASAFFDVTDWSQGCASQIHQGHHDLEDYAWASFTQNYRESQFFLARKIAFGTHDNLTSVGASSYLGGAAYPRHALNEADFLMALCHSDGLCPFPVGEKPEFAKWVKWADERETLIALRQLPVVAERGRAVALLTDRGIDLALASLSPSSAGCTAAVTVPFPSGTVLIDETGQSYTVSSYGTILVTAELGPEQGTTRSLKLKS